MYVCMYMCVCVCIFVCMYACTHVQSVCVCVCPRRTSETDVTMLDPYSRIHPLPFTLQTLNVLFVRCDWLRFAPTGRHHQSGGAAVNDGKTRLNPARPFGMRTHCIMVTWKRPNDPRSRRRPSSVPFLLAFDI